MARFKLELLITEKSEEEARQELSERITNILSEISAKQNEMTHSFLLQDIKCGKAWRILGEIDGYPHRGDSGNQKWTAEKAHEWSGMFSHEQLQEIFTIAVNSALLPYRKEGFPGYEHGHAIIYDHVAQRKESMFNDALDADFIKRLNNGRFWEYIDLLGSCVASDAEIIITDVLTKHFDDLDLSFVPNGLKIFYRNARSSTDFYLSVLPREAIEKYGEFMGKIDDRLYDLDITKGRFAPIVKAYIEAVKGKDPDGNPLLRDYEERLETKLVQKYLPLTRQRKLAA